MKKVLGFLCAALLSATMFAQVMSYSGVQNTLSTGFGQPYYNKVNSENNSVRFYGFIDTLQVRFDVSKFTVEGMLNWGAFPYNNGFVFQNTERNPFWYTNHAWYNDGGIGYGQGSWWTNGNTESYYVNFLFHPVDGLDIGMGTRLNWKIGPAPTSGDNFWGPRAHIIQGGLKDSDPGKSDVAGFAYYANKYTSNYHNGIVNGGQFANSSIGARYRYDDLFEIGFALPSWPDENNAKFNLAFKIHPVDFLSAYVAYDGILQHNYGNLYTGLSLYFDNFDLDVYLAGNFRPKVGNNDVNNDRVGLGVAATLGVPSINFTAKPELGFTFYMNPDYTLAWYLGSNFDISFAKKFNFGTWISVATGARDKRWAKSKTTEDWTNGFIFDIRPNFSFDITKSHELSIYFDYQNRTTYQNKKYNIWGAGIFWTYRN